MIKKYFDFINESVNLILESDVIYSDKFKLTLKKIDNVISKSLLDIENKDLDVRSNYFDIMMDKNDTVTFIPDRRAQDLIGDKKETVRFVGSGGWLTFNKKENGEYKNKNIFDLLEFTPSDELKTPSNGENGVIIKKVTSPTSGKVFAWVKFTDNELVINMSKLRSVDETTKLLWTTNRQEVRVGRAIRALLRLTDVDFLDKDIEEFVNLYKATIDKFNDKFSLFEEVKGEDIGKWYSHENYYRISGILGNSCMSRVDVDFFDIYISNPNVCSLVIFRSEEDNNKIAGRALLWTLRDSKRFMDRIYTINDSDTQLFKDYAKENGWYTKKINNSSAKNDAISPTGEEVKLDLIVDIKSGSYERYPYLDTVKYWNESNGTLSTDSRGNVKELESTDGDPGYECDQCGGSGEIECYDCGGSGETDCEICNGEGSIEGKDCVSCNGDGVEECEYCYGNGIVSCPDCQ